MSKQDMIEIEGTVTEALPNATFKVALEGGHEAVLGHLHHGTGIVGHVLGLDDLEGCRLVESARDTEGVALVNGLLGGVEQLLLAGLLLGRERRKLRRDLVLGQGTVVDGQLVDDAVEAVGRRSGRQGP